MRQIHFHIGDRKTGTSSLQSVLDTWDRSGAARAAGLLYPAAGRQVAMRINHRNLAHALDGDARYNPEHGTWSDLARNLNEVDDAGHVLISSESFENVDPKVLQQAVREHLGRGIEPVILCYFRPHMSRLLASYTQNAKRGLFDGGLNDFVRRSVAGRLGQAFPRLDCWRACFGVNFRLSLYQRDRLMAGDIVADILVRQMGLPADLLPTLPPSTIENRAPKPSTLAVLMKLRRSLARDDASTAKVGLRPELEAALTRLQVRLDAAAAGEPALQLDAATAETIHAACAADARAIDAAFFPDAPYAEAALEAGLSAARSAVAWQDPNADLNAAWLEAFDALVYGAAGAGRSRAEVVGATEWAALPQTVLDASDRDERRSRRKRRRQARSADEGTGS